MINSIICEEYIAETDVAIALCESYIKQCMLCEYSEDQSIYQEGKVGDFMTDKVQKLNNWVQPKGDESLFKKIIMFIPRMFNKLVQFIYNRICKTKIETTYKNLEQVQNNIDDIINALDDDSLNFDDDNFDDDNVEESYIDDVDDQITMEALGFGNVAHKMNFNTQSQRSTQTQDAADRMQQKRAAMYQKIGAKSGKDVQQQYQVTKKEALKALNDLGKIADKDKSMLIAYTKIMTEFQLTFKQDMLQKPEEMAKYVEQILLKNEALIEKAGKSGAATINRAVTNVTSMNMQDRDQLSPDQLRKYEKDCEEIERSCKAYLNILIEWEGKLTNIDVLKIANDGGDVMDKAIENGDSEIRGLLKGYCSMLLPILKGACDLSVRCVTNRDAVMKQCYQMCNITGKMSDVLLQQLEGGTEYKMRTIEMMKTILKCLKATMAVMKKFEENPELTRLLQISIILMRVAKLVLI